MFTQSGGAGARYYSLGRIAIRRIATSRADPWLAHVKLEPAVQDEGVPGRLRADGAGPWKVGGRPSMRRSMSLLSASALEVEGQKVFRLQSRE